MRNSGAQIALLESESGADGVARVAPHFYDAQMLIPSPILSEWSFISVATFGRVLRHLF